MGRELRRVPLDFNWSLNVPWKGFINPHYKAVKCSVCNETGYSPFAAHLNNLWYGYAPFRPEDNGSIPFKPTDECVLELAIRNVNNSPEYYGRGNAAIQNEAHRLCHLFNSKWMYHLNEYDVNVLIKNNSLRDFTHSWNGKKLVRNKNPIPSAREVNEYGIRHFCRIDFWYILQARCKDANEESLCSTCKGDGTIWLNEKDKKTYEEWESYDPPSGEGYQIWETVSEGSPISPVFSTPEDLANHMATTKWGSDQGTSYEVWLDFIKNHTYAPSFIMTNGTSMNGVEGVVALNKDNKNA